MPKIVTLRLDDDEYARFVAAAATENRSLSNLITTFALRHVDEVMLADASETEALRADTGLMKRLKSGSADARTGRGRFVE